MSSWSSSSRESKSWLVCAAPKIGIPTYIYFVHWTPGPGTARTNKLAAIRFYYHVAFGVHTRRINYSYSLHYILLYSVDLLQLWNAWYCAVCHSYEQSLLLSPSLNKFGQIEFELSFDSSPSLSDYCCIRLRECFDFGCLDVIKRLLGLLFEWVWWGFTMQVFT